MDVCDDSAYSNVAKSLHEKAKEKGVPCITSGGIYPGVSNLLAAEMLGSARKTSDGGAAVDAKPSVRKTDEESRNLFLSLMEGGRTRAPFVELQKLLFSYFTAGTGGAGPTILETSLLLAGEPVTGAWPQFFRVDPCRLDGETAQAKRILVGVRSIHRRFQEGIPARQHPQGR